MKKRKLSQILVSVIMPVYNAEAFLGEAIESILKQTYQHFELIIVDDASTDRSADIIKSYKKRFSRKMKVIRMKHNLNRGGDACANEGIKIARGKYIARMDADDIAHPERLEKQVAYLKKHPNVFLVGSNAYVIDAAGTVLGEKNEPIHHKDIYKNYAIFHPLIHSSVMVRRVVPHGIYSSSKSGVTPDASRSSSKRFESISSRLRPPLARLRSNSKIFQYDIKYSANNDYYTFFRLLCEGKQFVNLKEKLIYYRIHRDNNTFVHVKEKYLNTLKVRFLMVKEYGYKPTVQAIIATTVQSLILFTVPEWISTKLYLFSKGIVKIENPLRRILLYTNFVHFVILRATLEGSLAIYEILKRIQRFFTSSGARRYLTSFRMTNVRRLFMVRALR